MNLVKDSEFSFGYIICKCKLVDCIYIDEVTEFRTLGNLFVLATEKNYVDLKQKIDKYEIPYDYLILNHWALLLSKDLEILKVFTLDKELVDSILEYANNKDIYYVILISAFDKNVKDTSNIVKIMLKLYNYDKALEVKNYIDKSYTNIRNYLVRDEEHYLVEIVSCKASKSLMIEKILDKEKIERNNVYTIGDGINDIDMMKKYNGYKVKKTCEELNSVTNRVIDNVSDLISRISKWFSIIYNFVTHGENYQQKKYQCSIDIKFLTWYYIYENI